MHNVDLTAFQWINSQTTTSDRVALLSLQQIVLTELGAYSYLEVGSYLGGSLQPHVVQSQCTTIYSIDPRPEHTRDERSPNGWHYEDNSRARMFALLQKIPGAELEKVKTFECCSWTLDSMQIPDRVDYAFVDGEHTNSSVINDFKAVRRFLKTDAILAFHDSHIIIYALVHIRRLLGREPNAQYEFFHFPGSDITAIVFGRRLSACMHEYRWAIGLPISQGRHFKIRLHQRFPLLYLALRQCKRLFTKSRIEEVHA